MYISHYQVVLDACCILNFCATGQLLNILKSIPTQVVVTQVVQERELITLQHLQEEENDSIIQFETAIVQGLLKVVDFESEDEIDSFFNYAATLGDDGESATCAIAFHRGWAIASDDKRAISFIQKEAPYIQILSTPEIIKHWSEKQSIDASILSKVLNAIRIKGRYIPPKNDPLRNWWQNGCC